jgi:hypothetical protein
MQGLHCFSRTSSNYNKRGNPSSFSTPTSSMGFWKQHPRGQNRHNLCSGFRVRIKVHQSGLAFAKPPRRNKVRAVVNNVTLRPFRAFFWCHFFMPFKTFNVVPKY